MQDPDLRSRLLWLQVKKTSGEREREREREREQRHRRVAEEHSCRKCSRDALFTRREVERGKSRGDAEACKGCRVRERERESPSTERHVCPLSLMHDFAHANDQLQADDRETEQVSTNKLATSSSRSLSVTHSPREPCSAFLAFSP